MGKRTVKKRNLKLKHRAQATKTGDLLTRTQGNHINTSQKDLTKRHNVSQILQSNTNLRSSLQNQAPPVIHASKQLNAQRLKQKRDQLRQLTTSKHRNLSNITSMEQFIAKVQQNTTDYAIKTDIGQESNGNEMILTDTSRRAYMKELRKVIDKADVILQVLDARDPIGCRAIAMEEMIENRNGKKLVLILNKIDLVPSTILQPWLTYLRTFYPTIAFKASTQHQASHLSTTFGKADKANIEAIHGSKAVGTEALMQLLKNYCRNSNLKTAITVGVIGYPNVGKSSIINSLKRSKAASVSSTAGHTKVMQEIHIDSKIKLLDCPGIVFDHSNTEALLLRNCINTETMDDPIGAVGVILSRCTSQQLEQLYQLDEAIDCQDVIGFLVNIAKRKGKLGKGGVPDRQAAARIVLQDWNRGRIPYFTPPPDNRKTIINTQLVNTFGTEFDIDSVLNPSTLFASDVGMSEQAMTDMEASTTGPQCSFMVEKPTVTSIIQETMKALGTDDEESDEEMDNDYVIETSNSFTLHDRQFMSSKGQLSAKQKRKLKRRAAKQRIGAAEELDVCEQMDTIAF